MPHLTVCPKCDRLYEAQSEEAANEPLWLTPYSRFCPECYRAERTIKLYTPKELRQGYHEPDPEDDRP